MKLVIQIKRTNRGNIANTVYNTDTSTYIQEVPKNLDFSGMDEGLYILTKNESGKITSKRIDVGRIRDDYDRENIKLSIYNKKEYEEICKILNVDCITFSNQKDWIAFSIKYPVKRFYELGSRPELAYGIIEFEISKEEAEKYKLNLIEYKNGIAKAYRYKFSFYYMMNSNKNMSPYKLENYTKNMDIYCEYNPQCNIILRKIDGKIQDGQYITS